MKHMGKLLPVILCWALVCGAEGLFPCPDCEQPVSHRAVMCPNCGCPGEAVREAYQAFKAEAEGPPPVPVSSMRSDHARTVAVAMRCDDTHYLVADLWAVGQTTRLGFQTLSTEEPVAYRSMQIARDAPLVRFKTSHPDLVYLERSPEPDTQPSAWINSTGEIIEADAAPPDAIAALDGERRLLFLLHPKNRESVRHPIPDSKEWVDVAPGEFRFQLGLLTRAQNAADALSIDTRTLLKQTQWLSSYLKKEAHRISETEKENP